MRVFVRRTLLLFLLSTFNFLAAEESLDVEREQLLKKLKLVETALNEKDFNRLTPLLASDVVVVFLNGEVTRGASQVRGYFEKVLGGGQAILKDYTTQATIGAPARFIGDVVIADGKAKDVFTFPDGSEMKVDTLWTVTLAKREGDWKVLQLHFSSNFFDNPMVAAIERKLIIVAVIGLLIGVIAGYLLKRRRVVNA
jgi:ketosteroid isomerase-like protein